MEAVENSPSESAFSNFSSNFSDSGTLYNGRHNSSPGVMTSDAPGSYT